MKRLFFLGVAACIIFSSAHAATVNVSNVNETYGNSRVLVDSSNNLVTSGYSAVGYFTTYSTTEHFSGLNGQQIANDFNILGLSISDFTFTDGSITISGALDYSADSAISSGSPFIGKQAFVVVGNASTLALSTQAFIYATGVNFTVDPSTPISVNLSATTLSGQIVLGAGNGIATNFIDVGGLKSGLITNALQLTAIPEPSTFLLAILGVLALLRRRR